VDLGCDWVETDLRLTSDDFPILLHDATLSRTTNGKGAVGSTALSHVLRLDAGSWFSREFRGERVPTLEEALEWGRHRCGFNLEIKEEDRIEELIHRLASRFRGHAALDRVLFSSFRSSDLKRLRAALPHARLGWLVSRSTRGLTGLNRSVGLAALHPKEPMVGSRLVKRCHRLGLAMHVWVVNRARRIRELEAMGVDGVMTDDPRWFTM
jgi:glycerophosphoryl diester phosphodiesterase